MKNYTKKLKSIIFYILFLLNIIFFHDILKANIIYEYNIEEIITKGAKYENKRRITDKGFFNIHVIRADITNNNIKILPVQADVYGTKETTSELLKNKGAIAGINADYFNMKESKTTPMGSVISEGSVISLGEVENGYATFFIDKENNPFIEYLKPKIIFKNNGEINIQVQGINKYYKDFNAVYFDNKAIKDTSELDNKFQDLVKFVIKDNIITYISQGGEIVEVPENGYIIVAAATYAQYFYNSVKVGDKAEIYIEANFNFDTIKTAIGGAGKIVENGLYSNYGYVVSPTKRNPRSAIGINKEGTEIILVAVDGRGESIGATHKEMADILISLGVHNGMHLDGGGSTTMAVKTFEEDKIKLVNNIPGGVERKVINAIGIFNNAPLGNLTSLKIKTYPDKVFYGGSIDVYTFGLDDYLNKVELPENIQYSCDEKEGTFKNNVFYPKKLGPINISATCNNITVTKTIESLKLSCLYSEIESIEASKGDKILLNFSGVSTTGITSPVLGMKYEIIPSNLGIIENDNFIAKENGYGYIKATVDDICTYIPVNIGKEEKIITEFFNNKAYFQGSDETIKGQVSYENIENKKSLNLKYKFNISENIQTSYLVFKDKIILENKPTAIKISVYGDKSNNLLRAKFIDFKETEFIVDIVEKIDWEGFRSIEVNLPENISYPIKLESFYLVSFSKDEEIFSNIYFCDLIGIYKNKKNDINLPKNNTNKNYFYENLDEMPTDDSFYITILGKLDPFKEKPDNYKDIENIILPNFSKNSSLGIFLSDNIIEDVNFNTKKWEKEYKFQLFNNIALVSLNNTTGSFTTTSVYNWSFVNESKNSKADHIIIKVNKNPNLIKSKLELEMFKEGLKEIKSTGKNVFVVFSDGLSSTESLKDGINYINLGSLFKTDNSINEEFSILRFRIKNNNIKFDIKKIFKNSI